MAIDAKQMRRDATRSAIVDAAMGMLLEGGLDTVSVNQIAKRVGYTPGALYSYFSSRDALIASLQERIFVQIAETYSSLRDRSDAWIERHSVTQDVAALLRLMLLPSFFVEITQRHPQQYAFLSRMLGDPKRLVADEEAYATAPVVMPVVQDIVVQFTSAQEQGLIKAGPAVQMAIVFMASVQGVFLTQKLLRFLPGEEVMLPLMRETSDALLKGWGVSDEQFKNAEVHLDSLTQFSLSQETPS